MTNLDRTTVGAAARLGNAWHVGADLTPISEVAELDDEQRAGVLAFFAERPAGGFKAALRSVGIRATTREARDMLLDDEQVREVRLGAFDLDEKTVLTVWGEIIADRSHKDRFNAVKLAAGVLHGWRESTGVEHTGNVEVHQSDVSDAIERFTSTVVRLAERQRPELPSGEASE